MSTAEMKLGSAWEYKIGQLKIEIPQENPEGHLSTTPQSERYCEQRYCEQCHCLSEYPFMIDKTCIDCYNEWYV
jgi:hypothetical protein